MKELPSQWTLCHTTTLMPLALAHAHNQEREASLEAAERAITVIRAINSPSLSTQFVGYIQQELPVAFPTDPQLNRFVLDTRQRLLPAATNALSS